LCGIMGRQVEERPAEKSLSDPVMKEFKERVRKLKQDKIKLHCEFVKTRNDIIDLYNDLEEQPETIFHQQITDPNTQNFPLDPDSLEKVAVSESVPIFDHLLINNFVRNFTITFSCECNKSLKKLPS